MLGAVSGGSLEELGLRPGERVRWRRRDRSRWSEGAVTRRERDGSIAVRDSQGRAWAFVIERLEVRAVGPRGAAGWEPLIARARRAEQLQLFSG